MKLRVLIVIATGLALASAVYLIGNGSVLVEPSVTYSLKASGPEQANQFQNDVIEFANREGFQISDIGKKLPLKDGRKVFYLVMDDDDEQQILVSDFLEAGNFFIALYVPPNMTSKGLPERFFSQMHASWPGMVVTNGSR
tara:strand:+ start:1417 stop:1836 length:420 start_codon:yes stop_codon:yes gene_type:complete